LSASPGTGRRLKILLILRAPIGGLYRHVVDLAQGLGSRGHEVGMVMDSSLSDTQTDARIAGLGSPLSLGVHRMSIPRLFGPGDLSASLRIRRLARELDIDVLHGHGAKGGLCARLAALGVAERVAIYTPHGGVLHLSGQSVVGRVARQIERGLMGASDAIIFESHFAQSAFEAQIAPVRRRRAVIHNGLQKAEFAPLPNDTQDHDFVYVGELRELKGVDVLLEALAGLERPDGGPATLVAAGSGPDEARFKKLAQALGIADQVSFVGVKPARETFARGRCAVLPSRAESLPYVVLEAAAAGLPVIATDVGGVSEIFGPTADHLVPAGDAAALNARMQGFLESPETAREEARTRQSHIAGAFSAEAMTDAILKVYTQALARH